MSESPGCIRNASRMVSMYCGSNIFNWKGDILNCSCYKPVMLLERGMEVVEMVL